MKAIILVMAGLLSLATMSQTHVLGHECCGGGGCMAKLGEGAQGPQSPEGGQECHLKGK